MKLPEKLTVSSYTSLLHVIATINALIDFLKEQEPKIYTQKEFDEKVKQYRGITIKCNQQPETSYSAAMAEAEVHQQPSSRWEERFDKIHPCIDSHCDNNGTTIGGQHPVTGELEPLQCEYCYKERLPLKELFQSLLTLHSEAIRERVEALPIPPYPVEKIGDINTDINNQISHYAAQLGYQEAKDDILALLNDSDV